ncbi:MauE/DoxX family redox-associated membrane protein [Mucilaginibacter sp.]
MKKMLLTQICVALILLLFAYTATSKFLDYERFVFQMRLAPLPLMKLFAPILGWLMPVIEILIAIGLLFSRFRLKALYVSVILLVLFVLYITGMLLTNQHLPCTCGGIISNMSWKQHLIFNMVFIIIALTAILKLKKHKVSPLQESGKDDFKELSRA